MTLFLKNLFDIWYEDIMKGEMISIRYFDNLVGIFMGNRPEACGMTGECQCQKRDKTHSPKLDLNCFTIEQKKTLIDIKDFLNLTGNQILKYIYNSSE
jgi:uncharacterized protein